jgi:Tol biopolymer transport system component/DNA-binding winged helix-turn-helix (wHTH) protein
MQVPANGPRRLGFGLFQADLPARQLYRRGVLVHLQDQPFEILAILLQRPGEVVTREELQKRLWPEDTFVEFDEGLNTAIKKLRYALGDSPDNPAFIETVPRRGYRLIAPIRILDNTDSPHQGREFHERTGELAGLIEALKYSTTETQSQPATLMSSDAMKESGPDEEPGPAADARQSVPVVSARASGAWKTWSMAAFVCAVLLGLGANYLHRPAPQRPMHFSLSLPVAVRDLALSHDGRVLAFVAPRVKEGGTALWINEVGTSGVRLLENTESASYPFWSPDDRHLAFFADGKLKRVDVTGGPVQVICDAPIGRGGTWNREGIIVFAADTGVAIRRVAATGGPVTMVPGFEQKVATTKSNRWPVFLPDGDHFLYTSVDFGADLHSDSNAIYVAALSSPERQQLVHSNANAAYILPGYLLFLQNETLMAQRFDAARLQLTGEPVAVASGVEYLSSIARGLFSMSGSGTLVYQAGSGSTFSELVWMDREGRISGKLGGPARYANPHLSPDGKRAAVDIDDPQSSNTDIWVIETNRRVQSRFTFDPGQDEGPLWSHDGQRLLWLSDRGGRNGFYQKSSNGLATDESTVPVGAELSFASAPSDWSADGRFLLYTDLQEGSALHLWVLSMDGKRRPYRLLPGSAADVEGQFSPDGRWVAYSSNESGRWQVYVVPFLGPGARFQISTDGGQQPRWRRDGKELFFLSKDRRLMAAAVKTGSTFEFSPASPLFETHAHEPLTAEEFFTYDVSPDGKRFLVNAVEEQTNPHAVDIILNWASQLNN